MKPILPILAAALSMGFAANAQSITELNPRENVLPTLLSARSTPMSSDGKAPDKPLTLIHFSDLHGSTANLERIVEFRDAYDEYIDDAIHTGDAVFCYWDDPNPFEQVKGAGSILIAIGNHDCWKGHLVWAESNHPYDASIEDAYAKMLKRPISGWEVVQPKGVRDRHSKYYCACYYYKDYSESKIRLIVLDGLHYDKDQDEWFDKTLSEAQSLGYAVVAAQHFPAQCGVETVKTGFNSANVWELRSVPDPVDSQMEKMPEKGFATVDRFIDNGGIFVCWLSGHTHADFIGKVKGHEKQLQVIVEKAGEFDRYMYEDRTPGTLNQDAFNLFTVNPYKGLFTIQRIGSNRGDRMQSKKLFVYDYRNSRIEVSE